MVPLSALGNGMTYHALYLILLTSSAGLLAESDYVEQLTVLYPELTNSKLVESCAHKDSGNIMLKLAKKRSVEYATLYSLHCVENDNKELKNCGIHSSSAIFENKDASKPIAVSASFDPLIINDQDNYDNYDDFMKLLAKRRESKIKHLIDEDDFENKVRKVVTEKHPITKISMRENKVLFTYSSCGCNGVEFAFHDGTNFNFNQFTVASFTWNGCNAEFEEAMQIE